MTKGITNWIFDLDNTLYQGDGPFFAQIDKKMTEYFSKFLKLDAVEARKVQKEFLVQYGTSLAGLMASYDINPNEFLDYVHDISLNSLAPCENLQSSIASLPGRKFIYTNGSRGHAKNVGEHLGLYNLMDGIFALEDADFVPKPNREPYIQFCDRFDIDPSSSIFFEDSPRNLDVPKQMGMQTVFVKSSYNWHAPKDVHEQDPKTVMPWIDHVTEDLAQWLSAYT